MVAGGSDKRLGTEHREDQEPNDVDVGQDEAALGKVAGLARRNGGRFDGPREHMLTHPYRTRRTCECRLFIL